jgi:hypothetical protein
MTADEASKFLDGLVERLAAIEHERWSHWQRYMHGKATKQADGSLLIQPDLVKQWDRKLHTKYAQISQK